MTFGPPIPTFASASIPPRAVYLNKIHYGAPNVAGGTGARGTSGAGGMQMERVIIATCRSDGRGPYRVYPRRALANSAFAVEISDGPAGKINIRERKGKRST